MSLDDIQRIKDRLGIEEVIGSYIQIDKAGNNFKARCPFHNEKTPSFIISPDRNNYYCFGCGAKGDIFNFVQEFEGIDFSGALKILADRAGVKLEYKKNSEESKHDRIREVVEMATRYFEENLSKSENAKKYLLKRGLTNETINTWRIGFAINGWNNLYDHLKSKKFTNQDLEEAGLIKKNSEGKVYDRFRSRIIFPIFDSSGRPVAFTGRIFEGKDDEAKYLNSPETILFEKSKILHGYDKAKSSIRKFNFSILVEGQMDLILSHQANYKNTVASSGTALTKDQLTLISRLSNNLVIAYDSDGAGFRASEKAWQMGLEMGLDIKIAPIPNGSDPADVILANQENWKNIIKNSKHIIEILTEKIFLGEKDQRKIGMEVSKKVIPYLSSVKSQIDQAYFIKLISDKLNISEIAIRNELDDYNRNIKSGQVEVLKKDNFTNKKQNDLLKIEEEIFGILYWQTSQTKPIIKVDEYTEKIKTIIKDRFAEINSVLESEKDKLIISTEEKYYESYSDNKEINMDKFKKSITELLKNLKLKYLIIDRENEKEKLKCFEKDENDEDVKNCLLKISNLSRQIDNLE